MMGVTPVPPTAMTTTSPAAPRKDAARLFLARWVFTPLAGVRFRGWLSLLRRFGVHIPPTYWPRTLFTTLMSVGNSVIVRHENRRYGARLNEIKVKAPVFILGHHRSGTTHLWNLISLDPQFAYPTVLQAVFPHTFLTCESLFHGPAARLTPRTRPQDNVQFGADAPLEEERAICTTCFLSMQMARHFPREREAFMRYLTMRDATPEEQSQWRAGLDRFARKLLLRHGADRTLLFKAPDHTGKIRLILDLYPDARFIHIHRHPCEVYSSTLSMEIKTQPLYAYQPLDTDNLEEFVLRRYREMYDAFFADRALIPDGQFAEIAFDDLRREPVSSLERLYQEVHLGSFDAVLAPLEKHLETLAGYRMNSYSRLDEPTRERIATRWEQSFRAWSYPK